MKSEAHSQMQMTSEQPTKDWKNMEPWLFISEEDVKNIRVDEPKTKYKAEFDTFIQGKNVYEHKAMKYSFIRKQMSIGNASKD